MLDRWAELANELLLQILPSLWCTVSGLTKVLGLFVLALVTEKGAPD